MTKETTKFMTSFLKGVLKGISASFTIFNPPRVNTKLDKKLFESSYRSPSEDFSNIKRDFEKAISNVENDGWNGN